MGQQASGGVAGVSGTDWNATLDEWKVGANAAWKTVTRACDYTPVNLLDVTLEEAAKGHTAVAIERSDLTKTWKLEDFVRIGSHDSHTQKIHVALHNGQLDQLIEPAQEWEAQRRGYQLLELELPGLPKTVPKLKGGRNVYTVKVSSPECRYLAPIIRRCQSAREVVELLLEVLRAGAETLNITICHQMVIVNFDKIDIVQEQNDRVPDKARVLTSYLWVRMMHFRMVPSPDVLQEYFAEIKAGAVRERVIRKMRMCGLTETEIERFKEGTGGARRAGPRTDRYLRMMADHAQDRPFWLYRFPNDYFLEEQASLVSQENVELNMEQCCGMMINTVRGDSDNYKDWRLLVGWETMTIRTVNECLHEGRRRKALGDDTGFIKNSLHAVELASKKAKDRAAKMEMAAAGNGPSKHAKEALSPSDIEAILAANKDLLASMTRSLAEGNMTRERFEDAYEKAAHKIVSFLEGNILPAAREKNDKETMLVCMQTLADYLRYLHVFIPSERENVHRIEELYGQCAQLVGTSKELSPFTLAGLTSANNQAVFYGEIHRRYDLAAKVCREAIATRRRHITTGLVLSPSQTFNWHLLSHNLAAFETFLVVLAVGFNVEDMAAHEALDLGLTEEDEEKDFEELQMGGADLKHSTPNDNMCERTSSPLPARSRTAQTSQFSCLGGRDRFCLERTRQTFGGIPEASPPTYYSAGPGARCGDSRQSSKASFSQSSRGSPPIRGEHSRNESKSSIWSLSGLANGFESAPAPAPAAPVKVQDGMTRAVRRWIKSRPLHRWTEKDDDSDAEGEDRGHRSHGIGMPVVSQVRWVDHVEKQSFKPKTGSTPTAGSVSSKESKTLLEEEQHSSSSEDEAEEEGVEREKKGKVDMDIKQFQKAYADAVVATTAQPPERLHTFCISCAVRVNHKHMKDWQTGFVAELDELARDLHMIRAVHIAKSDVTDLLDCMDSSSGVVYRPARVGAEHLWPGDTLMMRGPLRGLRFPEAVKLFQEIKAGNISKGPMRIQFLRAMPLAQQTPSTGGTSSLVKILGAIPYTEVHHHFSGFRDHSVLKMRSQNQSLTKLVADFNHQAEVSSKSSKVTPCRLRNLSSVRSPIYAGTTGCE